MLLGAHLVCRISLKSHLQRHGEDTEMNQRLSDHFRKNPEVSGGRLSDYEHLFQYRVLEAFPGSGKPLIKPL